MAEQGSTPISTSLTPYGAHIATEDPHAAESRTPPQGVDVLPTSEELGTLNRIIKEHVSNQQVNQQVDQSAAHDDRIF